MNFLVKSILPFINHSLELINVLLLLLRVFSKVLVILIHVWLAHGSVFMHKLLFELFEETVVTLFERKHMSVIVWELDPLSHYSKVGTFCNIGIFSLKYGSAGLRVVGKSAMFLLMQPILGSFNVLRHHILDLSNSTRRCRSSLRFIIYLTNPTMLIVSLFSSVWVLCLYA